MTTNIWSHVVTELLQNGGSRMMRIVYSMLTQGQCLSYLLCGCQKNDSKTSCSWTSELFIASGINKRNLSLSCHSNSSIVITSHSSDMVMASNLTEPTLLLTRPVARNLIDDLLRKIVEYYATKHNIIHKHYTYNLHRVHIMSLVIQE